MNYQATLSPDIIVSGLVTPISFAGGVYPGTTGTCGTTIPAYGKCFISFAAMSSSTGNPSQNATLNHDIGGVSYSTSFNLSANLVDSSLVTITEGSFFDFGFAAYNDITSHMFTIYADGQFPVSSLGAWFSGPFAFLGGAYPGTGGTCCTFLSAGATCTIAVILAPPGMGPVGGDITVSYFDGVSNHFASATLSGTGIAPPVKEVVTTQGNTCVLLNSGSLRCWGSGSTGINGQGNTSSIGDSAPIDQNTPIVQLAGSIEHIDGSGNHVCAISSNLTLKCWGANSNGQLGLGNTTSRGTLPNQLGGSLPTVNLSGDVPQQVSAGMNSTCLVTTAGTVRCWGMGTNGQLGYDATTSLTSPGVALNLGAGRFAKYVRVGSSFACALLDNDSVKCWGLNSYGQLGQGSTSSLGD